MISFNLEDLESKTVLAPIILKRLRKLFDIPRTSGRTGHAIKIKRAAKFTKVGHLRVFAESTNHKTLYTLIKPEVLHAEGLPIWLRDINCQFSFCDVFNKRLGLVFEIHEPDKKTLAEGATVSIKTEDHKSAILAMDFLGKLMASPRCEDCGDLIYGTNKPMQHYTDQGQPDNRYCTRCSNRRFIELAS